MVSARSTWLVGFTAIAVSCTAPRPPGSQRQVTPRAPSATPAKPRVTSTLEAQGLSSAAMDRKVDPCNDFFAFACGGWIAANPIPPDKPRWHRSSEIAARNEAVLKEIVELAAANSQLGRFYRACMDTAAIARAGSAPLRPTLNAISGLRDRTALARAVAQLHRQRVWAFFSIASAQDSRDATKVIAMLDQNGLGLPTPGHYTKPDVEAVRLRDAYRAHVTKMFVLAGRPQARARRAAVAVLDVESALANVSKSVAEQRDPASMYHPLDREALAEQVPSFDWKAYFETIQRADLAALSVTSLEFFAGVEQLLKREPLERLKDYLAWQFIRAAAPRLGQDFEAEAFALEKLITGQQQPAERWKRCIEETTLAVSDSLARPFVERRFSAEAKQRATQMVHAVLNAMRTRLQELDWMDAETRDNAVRKLGMMGILVGYPDEFTNYDFDLTDVHYANVVRAAEFAFDRDLAKIGKPLNRREWIVPAQRVSGYYLPDKNHMAFSAGVLQPPFFDLEASDAANLGAIGMIIGHEISHGFDDEGAQFDGDGNVTDWWTPHTREIFRRKAACVERQYAAYQPFPGVHLDGKATLGENIADAGGLTLAHRAFRSLRAAAEREVIAEGFSEEQQFFIGMGQLFCAHVREPAARLQIQNARHSLPRYRVNGPLSQFPAFARAFECPSGSRMAPEKRCSVW